MTGKELIDIFKTGIKRYHLIGDVNNGVIVGLDLEGRLYTIFDGEVVSKVNPDAIKGITTREEYLNPGGDGLWPAPEGTCFGYEYSTGKWRVPPGLTGAAFRVVKESEMHALIEAEIDLINAAGLGIPTIFRRDIFIDSGDNIFSVKVIESIEYTGTKTLTDAECLLVPWTLCQFECSPGCEVVLPEVPVSEIWDMYDASDSHRYIENGQWHIKTDGTLRFQVGMSAKIPWLELHIPAKDLIVRRIAEPISPEEKYIDIIDADPAEMPSDKGVRYSVYCDTAGFMEIEAAGGFPDKLIPGSVISLQVTNEYRKV